MQLRVCGSILTAGLFCALAFASAQAAQTVNVSLQDATDAGVQGMKMTATPDTVKAGQVTIHATNESKGLVHEVIVVRPKGNAALPYDAKTSRVIESRITHLGEVSDLEPGKSGSLTVTLTPGKYLLICNQPGHYKGGMWTRLTVTK